MTIRLAFYTGSGRPTDWVIRWWTGEPISHVELVTRVDGDAFFGLSASPRDGGVRGTWINEKEGHWMFLDVPGDADAAADFIRARTGAPYDWPAIWGWHVLGCRGVQWPGAWLCSEIIAHAIGAPHLAHMSPGALYRALD